MINYWQVAMAAKALRKHIHFIIWIYYCYFLYLKIPA
jgi:hypothetical protein